MPRKPRPITESWQHGLTGRALIDAFLDCASAAVALGIVPAPCAEHVVFTLAFEELSGGIEEVRSNLRAEDVEALQAVSFRLSSTAVASRPSVHLSASPIRRVVSLDVQNARATSTALDLVATVHAKFPRLDLWPPDLTAREAVPPELTSSAPARLHPGLHVDHYRLIRRLGAGYSGEVWQVEVVTPPPGVGLVPGQVVAMKQYFPIMLSRSADTLRIQREFQVASEIRHENLVSVYDLVLSPSRTFGSFLIMEYAAGQSLKAFIGEDGLDVRECVRIGRQLCAALVELHSYGALHRDIKPANIVVLPGQQRTVKLLDLGIVSLLDEHGLTGASEFLGSKHTSAPEQLFGEEIDERADVYALGATLHQCYHGKPLYDETGPVTAVVRTMLESPRSCEPKPGADADELAFVSFVRSCLELDPAKRPTSARHCQELLDRLAR